MYSEVPGRVQGVLFALFSCWRLWSVIMPWFTLRPLMVNACLLSSLLLLQVALEQIPCADVFWYLLGLIVRSGIIRAEGQCIHHFAAWYPLPLHRSCTMLHLHVQWFIVSVSLRPCQLQYIVKLLDFCQVGKWQIVQFKLHFSHEVDS